jgi:hypothetical protein
LDASQEQAASFWRHMGFTPCPELGRNAIVPRQAPWPFRDNQVGR